LIATARQAPIYMLSLSAEGMDDDALLSLLASTAPRSILLIEDIDAAGAPGAPRAAPPRPPPLGLLAAGAGAGGGGLTLPGLLNALDGVAAQESTPPPSLPH
jgi:hypothetical protein